MIWPYSFKSQEFERIFHGFDERWLIRAHEAWSSRWSCGSIKLFHFIVSERPVEDVHILEEVGWVTRLGCEDNIMLINPSQGYLNAWFIVVFTNGIDQFASDELFAISKRGICFDLDSFGFAIRDNSFGIWTHADMELHLIDSWHQDVTSAVACNQAFDWWLAEVGNSKSFCVTISD